MLSGQAKKSAPPARSRRVLSDSSDRNSSRSPRRSASRLSPIATQFSENSGCWYSVMARWPYDAMPRTKSAAPSMV